MNEKAPARQRQGQIFASNINSIIDTAPLTKAQARVLAERLFALEAGMNRATQRTTALERAGGADDRQP